jgi:hypothetical protein
MSTLSAARQVEFDFLSGADERVNSPTSIGGSPSGRASSADILELPRFPNFANAISAQSAASRLANRVNARAISEADHRQLLLERQQLLDKELSGTMTPEEENRLAYVRWSLDRVDDARYGDGLDKLETIVQQYERFQRDIEKFHAELERLSKSRRSYP